MKVGVVQHRIRESGAEDARALARASSRARDLGAELVMLPEALSLFGDENPDRRELFDALAEIDGSRLMPYVGPDAAGFSGIVTPPPDAEFAGSIALLVGDACVDPGVHRAVLAERPNAVVLSPRSESELQAEAVLELAIGLSLSLAGLVVVAECSGADPGEPGHGGSAIVLLGEVIAEAMAEEDVLVAEVPMPVPQPEPAEELPSIPPILAQRLAHHRGEKVAVDYPADLSS